MVNCSYNPLVSLPKWENVEDVWIYNTKIISVPNWKKAERVWIWNNSVKLIPFKDKIVVGSESNPCEWRVRYTLYIQSLIRFIYNQKLLHLKNLKEDLHIELQYSPDLEFYKNTEECKHFKKMQTGHILEL